MNIILSPEQIAQYREVGYLLVPDFLNAEELNRWRNAAEAAVETRLAALQEGKALGELRLPLTAKLRSSVEGVIGEKGVVKLRRAAQQLLGPNLLPAGFSGVLDTNQGDQNSFYARVYTQVIGTSRENEELRRFVRDTRLGEMVARLAEMSGVRIYHDQALFKMPGNNFTSWHLDAPFWSFHSPQALTMWLALDDATEENGCMQYLPRSHHTARMDKNLSIGADFDGLLKLYPNWRGIEPVAIPCRAGTAVFHNGLIAHAAGSNRTDQPRRAYAVAFMPHDAAFNGIRDVMPNQYFKTLKVGDRLDNDALYPLIWKPANPACELPPAIA